MEPWQRTVTCGKLRSEHIGTTVTLNGWANSVRNHGGVVFIDMRDRTGLVQVRTDSASSDALVEIAASVRPEFVISVTGNVIPRAEGMENPKMETGAVEVNISNIEILNTCHQPLPFQVSDESAMSQVNEELRLKYRYMDLRRPAMYEKLRLRHEIIRKMREYMYGQNFLEIETPILTKSTPEGARDYLVPYRLEPGLFYALPQAPQQFKQLLMVSGVERYFQVAKCFRDESQRADRQPEFTQLDIEMSFVTQEDILTLVEAMTIFVVESCSDKKVIQPFPRLTYDEAIRRFGSDKPDLRYGLELVDLGSVFAETEFTVFKTIISTGGQVKAIRFPTGSSLSRKEIGEIESIAKEMGAKGMAYFIVEALGSGDPTVQSYPSGSLQVRSPIAKFLAEAEIASVLSETEAAAGDLVLFIADKPSIVAKSLDRIRRAIADRLGLADKDSMAFTWITDFPVFEWDEENNRWTYAHNPFSMPKEGHMEWIESDPEAMRAYCYDIACNGVEWASGSVRIHKPEIQKAILLKLGLSDKKIEDQFGHMLEAFTLGAPPHGGIAPGVDRLVMFLTEDDNIREVIAFPKMGGGFDPLMQAPSPVDDAQLNELSLKVIYPEKKA